jgi:hypothetical protein
MIWPIYYGVVTFRDTKKQPNFLIDACAAAGFRQMIGYIDAANAPSIGLHIACGFRQIGYLPSVAYKFGQWADMIMVQRSLGSGGMTAPDVWPTVAVDDSGQ